MNSSALQLFTFFIIWLFSYTVNADPAHCVANAGNPDAEIDVWLHYQSFEDFLYDESGTLGGLTVDEVIGALLQSMEEWNLSLSWNNNFVGERGLWVWRGSRRCSQSP
ncbi:hypothetical protein FRD01_23160 [Microvenator marinus]|uniref:Uncharacterized protein n=1 Tax=Microvenator marinus TaxID=2600177 RepID=A0A5B8XY09_9DELT|nr:hypothetical protein [Microvenator marinus]QED30081.1 hypothetical protein FRD01_23160 [Microvenator marinus]